MKASVKDEKSFRDAFMRSLSIVKKFIEPSCYNGAINFIKLIFIEQMILGLCHLSLIVQVQRPHGNDFYLALSKVNSKILRRYAY